MAEEFEIQESRYYYTETSRVTFNIVSSKTKSAVLPGQKLGYLDQRNLLLEALKTLRGHTVLYVYFFCLSFLYIIGINSKYAVLKLLQNS